MTWKEELQSRGLPELLRLADGTAMTKPEEWERRRKELKDILCQKLYGYSPVFPVQTRGEIRREDSDAYGGKAIRQTIWLTFQTAFNSFSFPFELVIPKQEGPVPVFVYLGFSNEIADGVGEELIDEGYGIAHVYYQNIVPDRDDGFQSGMGRFCTRNPFDSWGKIGMWAYGAARMMDYLLTEPLIDGNRIAVMGHSRLGKTALWCGASDERFSLVVSNDSGGGGAALFRGKTGERIRNLSCPGSRFWFCGNFPEYSDREEELPFDQHFLLALAAPRHIYIASASRDEWADPHSEWLACMAATPVYEFLGEKGLICPDEVETGTGYHEGRIGYHLRRGTHYLSREDWHQVIHFRRFHGI